MADTTKLDAALAYAGRGWPVFPLRGKIPAIPAADGGRGCLDATVDPEEIRSWWQRYRNANVGIATGNVSGFWVLDIDGEQGEEALAELEHRHEALPHTIEALTGKGRHVLFIYTGEPIKNCAGFLPGLDTRATGGYIVAAPSYHKERDRWYSWDVDHHPDDVALATAPNWLTALVKNNPPEAGITTIEDAHEPSPYAVQAAEDMEAYVAAAIISELGLLADAGPDSHRRNNQLNLSAFAIATLVGAEAVPEEWARDKLESAALQIGLPIIEIRRTIASAFRAGLAAPRLLPE